MGKSQNDGGTPATTATSATRPNYPEAVRRSKKLIQSGLREEMTQLASGEFMLRSAGGRMLRYKTGDLMAWAEAEAEGFDALRLSIADEIERGHNLPDEAREWLLQYLRGKVCRPKSQAGRKLEFWIHHLIWMAVSARVQEGMKATRNDASEAVSACDAVADAMAELDLQPSTFYGVKRVWQDMKKRTKPGIPAT